MRRAVALVVLALTASGVTADWWSDFSNNLFTDLTPLIALFGEQPTKQFLSESLTFLDYFIFAMAPLGILTAVVSAIRVRGGSSVRAFIGRAQEGAGAIEAELCSSTSRDICELYIDGGIARDFGTPQLQLLELVHDPNAGEDDFIDTNEKDATAGLYPSRDYFNGKQKEWEKDTRFSDATLDRIQSIRQRKRNDNAQIRSPSQSQASQEKDAEADLNPPAKKITFAPAPNLTLSLWMRRPHKALVWLAAIAGGILQTGVVVVAGVLTYHLGLETEDIPSTGYGFPAMAAGTLLLCIGNFLCAFMVGESTRETTFMRKSRSGSDGSLPTRMVWLQRGGQVIGDQTFDCFGYNDSHNPNPQYITSWKDASQSEGGGLVLLAIVLSTAGFAAQFVGLRGLHPLVSVAQLGAMILMSAIRSLLRTQRLSKSFNLLDRCSDILKGHELDWLAMHLELDNARPDKKSFIRDICDQDNASTAKKPAFWIGGRAVEHKGAFLAEEGSRTSLTSSQIRVFGAHQNSEANFMEFLLKGFPNVMPPPDAPVCKMLAYRTRLARLTNPSEFVKPHLELPAGFLNWRPEQISCREQAEILVSVIEQTADLIFVTETPFWNYAWKSVASLSWAVSCQSSAGEETSDDAFWLNLWRQTPMDRWGLDVSVVEAVLGLWVMSLEMDPKSESYGCDQATNSISQKQRKVSKEIIIDWSFPQGDRKPNHDSIFSNTEMWWLGQSSVFMSSNHWTLRFESGTKGASCCSNSYSLWSQAYSPPMSCYSPGEKESVEERPPAKLETNTSTANDDTEERKMCRFFGWNTLQNPPAGEVELVAVQTSASLANLCARELYASFVSAVLPMVDLSRGIMELHSDGDDFQIKHGLLEKIFRIFQSSGLGSRHDAALCTIPAILSERRAFPDQYQFFKLLQLKFRELREVRNLTEAGPLYHKAAASRFYDRGEGTLWLASKRIQHIADVFFQAAIRNESVLWIPKLRRRYDDLAPRPLSSGSLEEAMEEKRFGEAFILLKDDDSERPWAEMSPLIQAIKYSLKEGDGEGPEFKEAENATTLVEALLEAGFDPDEVDECSRPALILSVRIEAVWAVESLLRHGAAPAKQDNEGMSAFHHAALVGNAKLLEVLLSSRNAFAAKVQDKYGKMFLDYVHESRQPTREAMLRKAMEYPDTKKIVCCWALRRLAKDDTLGVLQLVFSASGPIFFLDADVMSAAVLRQREESNLWSSEDLEQVLQVLARHGFAMGTSEPYARVFLRAILEEPKSTMDLLLKLNPKLAFCSGQFGSPFRTTPLMAAIQAYDLGKAQALLSHGATTDPGETQGTLLHFAVRLTSEDPSRDSPKARIDTLIELIRLLTKYGVSRDATDGVDGETACELAREASTVEGWDRVVEALKPEQESPS